MMAFKISSHQTNFRFSIGYTKINNSLKSCTRTDLKRYELQITKMLNNKYYTTYVMDDEYFAYNLHGIDEDFDRALCENGYKN